MKKLNGAQIVAIITFVLPPSMVSTIAFLAGVFDFDALLKLMLSWPILVFLMPFVVGVPVILHQFFRTADSYMKSKDFEKLKSIRKKIIFFYLFSSFGSAFTAIPICYYNGFSASETTYGTLIAVCYVFAASVPLSVKFLLEVDKVFKDIPTEFLPITSIRLKVLAVNLSITTGGGALLLVAIHCLLWRFESFPELGVTPEVIFYRLIAIISIIVVFQIIPNMIINTSNIRDIKRIKRFVEEMSNKDLTTEISLHSRDEFGEISERLNTLNRNFKNVLNTLKRNTAHLFHSSVELRSLSSTLSVTSNGQAANAEEIAASVEETSANLAASTENAEESVNMSSSTHDSVQSGQELIIGTQKNVKDISEKVVIIQELADQTNLLAINAFIEAANAGDHGKGFAVVAEEIRKLADRSGSGAKEIENVVKNITNNAEKNKSLSSTTKSNFSILKKEILNVKTANNEISSAMNEQKSANQLILDSIINLKALINTVGSELQIQSKEGENIKIMLEDLKIVSKEISTAMQEEKSALIEAATATEEVSGISNNLQGVSKSLQDNFKNFKTD